METKGTSWLIYILYIYILLLYIYIYYYILLLYIYILLYTIYIYILLLYIYYSHYSYRESYALKGTRSYEAPFIVNHRSLSCWDVALFGNQPRRMTDWVGLEWMQQIISKHCKHNEYNNNGKHYKLTTTHLTVENYNELQRSSKVESTRAATTLKEKPKKQH